jgi:hypothetical protein
MSTNSESEPVRYPLLESVLRQKGRSLQGIYKYKDAAEIFDASVRTIQQWVRDRKLRCRDLPEPFVWIKTADQILASIARFAQQTSTIEASPLTSRITGTGD